MAQLIQQSLEQDRLKLLAQQPSVQLNSSTPVQNITLLNKESKIKQNLNRPDEFQIKSRINALEEELSGSQKKAEQMCDVLENTRSHYSQLENKYNQARKLLKNYQERSNFKFS